MSFWAEPALLHRGRVVLPDHRQAAVERLLAHLDHAHRDAGIGEVHGDAAAHGAGADHRRRLDRPHRRLLGHVRDLGHLALGEEDVDLGLRLGGLHALREELALAAQPLVEGQGGGRLHRVHAAEGREEAAGASLEALAELREDGGIRPAHLVLHVADLPERLALGDQPLGEGAGALEEVAGDHLVHDAEGLGLRGGNGIARHDESAAPPPRRSSRGSRWVPPAPGRMPSFTSGKPTWPAATAQR